MWLWPVPTYLAYLAPVFLLFELVQLIVSERYLGIKQIEVGTDPRVRGPSEPVSALWVICLGVYWAWMGAMLHTSFARTQVVVLLAAYLIGYAVRRNCSLRKILVVLTLEGAVRIGMLFFMCVAIWRYHSRYG